MSKTYEITCFVCHDAFMKPTYAGAYSEDAFPETISLIDFGVDVFKS